MSGTHRRVTRRAKLSKGATAALAGLLGVAGIVATTAAPASAAVTAAPNTAAGATTIATAMSAAGFQRTGASFSTVPASSTVNGTSTTAIGGFPSPSGPFGILTTGSVSNVLGSQSTLSDVRINDNLTVRGNSARDTTVLKIDFTAPTGTNCLSMDFKFLSEEFPEYVGQQFNDGFVAELDSTTWTANQTTNDATITAPNSFAKDSSGNVVSVNSTGIGGLSAANASGTVYDGATTLLRANTQVAPGAHSLYLSIFDQGDARYDSAVFVNNLRTSFVPNPAVNCVPGAQPVSTSMTLTPATDASPVGTTHTVTAKLKDSNGVAIPNGPVSFTVTGANTASGVASTNPAGNATFTYTGNLAGTDQISACYLPVTTCLATASATEVWNPPVVVTAEPKTKVYGTADPDFTFTTSGGTLTTPPTCGVSGAHTSVGSYPITCSGAAAGPDQDVTYVAGQLTVTPATVTIAADNKARQYGAPDPAFTSTTSGLVGSDTLTTAPTCGVSGAHADVGSYPITCSGAAASNNYTIAYTPGTLSVGKATVTITATSRTKTYGEGDPALTFTTSGLVGSDSLTTAPTCTVSGPHANVGTYPITCSGASAGGNYDVAYVAGTLTVGQAEVVITAVPGSKVFGTADPAFTATVAGLAGGDTLVTQPACTVAGAHSDVGSYAITCSGADAGSNYTVRYETGTLQVTRATATVIADNQSKVYGTADPSYTFAVQGLVGGDTLTTPATCSVAGAHHDVGTYPITCSGASAGGNYDIAYLGGTLTVTKATVVVTAEPRSKAYGAADPGFTSTVSGLVGDDALLAQPSCSVSGPHADAGSYPIVCSGADAGGNYTVSYVDATLTVTPRSVVVTAGNATKVYGQADPAFGYTVDGLTDGDQLTHEPSCDVAGPHHGVGGYAIACAGADAGGNYAVSYADGLLTVTPKALAVTAANATKTYGDPDPVFGYTVHGLVGSDALVDEPVCEPRIAHDDAGSYPILCTDADAGDNYTIEYFPGELDVLPAGVVVTADNQSITYGDSVPAFTWSVAGIDAADLVTDPTCAVAGAHTAAGSYAIECSGADAGPNHTVSYQAGTLSVGRKVVTIGADSKATVFGDDDPAFTWTSDGLVGPDALTTDPTCGVAGAHSDVGSYPITCSGADAGDDYTVEYAGGTLTVTAKPGVVVADDQQITFGEDDPAFTYQVSGLHGSDQLVTPATCTVSGPHSDVGTYPITCSGGSAGGNYTLSHEAGSLVVVPAGVRITADNKSRSYGTADPAFTHQVDGLLGGDELVTAPTCGVSGPHAAAGEYDISCSGADAGHNYAITYVDGTLEVTRATVTVTADSTSKVYGAGDPAYTFGVTGLVGGDALVTAPHCTVAGAHANVGSYAITCSGADAGPNYTVGYEDGTLTVTPATLTVTADDKTKVQGNPLPTFTATFTGYVNGDDRADVDGAPALSTSATATSPAGTYPITAAIGTLSTANYTFAFVPGTLTVTSQPPTATITTPPDGAVYFQGQVVKASYSCADPDGTVTSCVGTVPAGAAIDTATTGTKTFSVTATDNNALTGTASTSYRVVPVAGVCRGTAVSLLGITLGDANAATSPCATRTDRILRANVTITPALLLLPAQSVKADVIEGATERTTGGSRASAEVAGATITVAGATIKVDGLTSSASSQLSSCTGAAATSGQSKVAGLTINGVPVVPAGGLSTPLKVDVGLVAVALNEQTRSGNTVTQTALRIKVLGAEIVLGRSVAGADCGS
ncbi:MBG domain-containing protein [Nocardioides kongjuensis]|uniref:Big-1 domain-containing protein n=1 Tax=Nocardioides kongjuensis TaxID=349522 RepID=A0A852RHK4_9ACTN|nr:MBG domain-containing protein [Nocardioides kongjuensis]NYD30625.1 hypothetical protein [Nocardioides kongjuensis]